jgi:hypothetical protein
VPALLGAILLASAGCTSTPAGVDPAWSRVDLPRGVEPVTLTASGPLLLVGGRAVAGQVRPRLLRIAPDGSSAEIPLTLHSPYAAEARWQSIVSDGHRVIAVGGAPGGAHSNTRWTTWAGAIAGVAEAPQSFNTFGGWGAGNVMGPVITSAGPVIAGSWAGARSGLDAAIWLPAGDRWVRQPSAGTALESTPSILVGPRSATGAGAGIVIPGSVVRLTGGVVRQSAAVWRSVRVNSGWARVDLPGSGANGEAVSARCGRQDCVLAGYVDKVLALWRLSQSGAAVRIPDVPQLAANPKSPIPAPLVTGGRIIEVVSAGPRVVVLSGGDRPWTVSRGPDGKATSSALVGGWVYVIAEKADGSPGLWRCPAKDLG